MSTMAFDLGSDLGGGTIPKSLADIIAVVRFRGDFRNTIRFPDANLTTEIQAAWCELYELIADTNEGYFDVDSIDITVANQPYIPLPIDAWRVRAIDVQCGSEWRPLDQVGIADRNRFSSTPGDPVAYRLTARGADIFPVPSGAFTLRTTYTPIAPVLGSGREFYNGWEEYVVYGALLRLALNEQSERVSGWEKQLEFQRARISRGASQRKAQEPDYLPLRDCGGDSEIDRDQRWR